MYELTYKVENGHYFADIFKWSFLHENVLISIKLSLTIVFKDQYSSVDLDAVLVPNRFIDEYSRHPASMSKLDRSYIWSIC